MAVSNRFEEQIDVSVGYEKIAVEVTECSTWRIVDDGWLWRLRCAEVQAELTLARGDWEQAMSWADSTIERSRARGRVKYEVLGLDARAKGWAALGQCHLLWAHQCNQPQRTSVRFSWNHEEP